MIHHWQNLSFGFMGVHNNEYRPYRENISMNRLQPVFKRLRDLVSPVKSTPVKRNNKQQTPTKAVRTSRTTFSRDSSTRPTTPNYLWPTGLDINIHAHENTTKFKDRNVKHKQINNGFEHIQTVFIDPTTDEEAATGLLR